MTLQSDPGWVVERRGLLTASRMAEAMCFLKNGKEGEARRKYKIELLAERVADYAVSHYVTPAMQRGLDLEPAARMAYEAHTGEVVQPARLIHHAEIDGFAATPDGFLTFAAGIVEFKVPQAQTFIDWTIGGVIPEDRKPQLLAQLACTRAPWVDFCAYCPELPEARQLFMRRFEPPPDEIAKVEEGARAFLAELDEMFCQFTERAA